MPSLFKTNEKAKYYGGGYPGINIQTLSGTLTLTEKSKRHQKLDANGANRDVILPAEEYMRGREFWIWNNTTGDYNLVVKNDGGTKISDVENDAGAAFICDDGSWYVCKLLKEDDD